MIRIYLPLVASIVLLTGCIGKSENEVVVYTALDKEFSESILDEFEAESAVDVLPKYDKESNKTVGLAEEIINQQNRQRPMCSGTTRFCIR